ncbi:phenylacetyl-CoA ligase [Penicillium digitatum]|uniref:Phenylacetyl-CoA ligase n=1 Tax=Penicillium digitatum TaxID=36651 RepID=A0A7T6XJW1_PENDI|nr:phenylacetyl-CoA ligase [Penicillium digitatum]
MAALSARRNSEYHSYLGALRPLKAGDARPPPPPVDELIGQSYPIGYLQQRHDLETCRCRTIFTCPTSLPFVLSLAYECGIPSSGVYLLGNASLPQIGNDKQFLLSDQQLIAYGTLLEPIRTKEWQPVQGRWQVAFLSSANALWADY